MLPADTTDVENLHALCKEVLYIYNNFAVELSTKLNTLTWETLQHNMLSITFDIFNKTSNTKILDLLNFSQTTQANEYPSFGDHIFGVSANYLEKYFLTR